MIQYFEDYNASGATNRADFEAMRYEGMTTEEIIELKQQDIHDFQLNIDYLTELVDDLRSLVNKHRFELRHLSSRDSQVIDDVCEVLDECENEADDIERRIRSFEAEIERVNDEIEELEKQLDTEADV